MMQNRETRDDPNLPTKTQQVTISTLIFMLENKTKPGNEIKSHLNESLDFSLSTCSTFAGEIIFTGEIIYTVMKIFDVIEVVGDCIDGFLGQ